MTRRRVNDDEHCSEPENCRATGSGLCRRCAMKSGQYSAARKKAWADPAVRARMSAASKKWSPPPGTELLFDGLRKKVGKTEARRLVEEHARARGRRVAVELAPSV